MKLYTEEQVRKAMNDYANTSSDLDYVMDVEMAIIEQLTPIELPSDENIEEKAEFLFPTVNRMGGPTYIAHKSFIEGAKWMNEQILKNK